MRKFITEFEAEVAKAVREADRAPHGSATREGWLYVANSWRLLAERTIAERTGGEFPRHTLH